MLGDNSRPSVMRSLAISPNLDALLEHEERMGGFGQEAVRRGNLKDAVGSGGLRPPPRGNRRCKREKAEESGGEWRTSRRNPYINRAPEDEVGHGRGGPGSQQSQLEAVLTVVDLFSDDNPQSFKSLSDRVRRRLTKPRKPSISPSMPGKPPNDEGLVLDIRRFSSDCIDITAEWSPRHRPLDSHARSSSWSSLDRRSFIDFSPTSSNQMLLQASTPKPIFSIPTSLKPSRAKSVSPTRTRLPPTTNFLDTAERADLVKKSRKLTRLFGETPDGDMLSQKDVLPRLDVLRTDITASGRRHSIPLTPDDFSQSFLHLSALTKPSSWAGQDSLESFIDVSDDEDVDDEAISPIMFAPNPVPPFGSLPPLSPSSYHIVTPELRPEEQRRRNREKLAKLHRFLGSRVPADLVLGLGHHDPSLPPIQPSMPAEDPPDSRKQWLRRRHSSSSAGSVPSWSDDIDRMKEDLNDKEKAINVRRAQKMEKMFGVAPPQTLYHTRHSPSPSVPTDVYIKRSKSQSPPIPSFGGFIPPGEVPSPTYQQRNPNRSSYIKQRPKKTDRPNTAESSRRLLPEGQNCYSYTESPPLPQGSSLIYHHYQHSLKSLGDILDRDDKESLAELHQYLNDYEDNTNTASSPLCETPLTKDRRLSNASSMKSERRRSLPARTSILSLASEYSIATPKPEVSEFQVRRRRAAKLTQFFGVNYRELINDILESLETGLEHERKRGTLRAEELEDLLERLRKIKMTRKGFF